MLTIIFHFMLAGACPCAFASRNLAGRASSKFSVNMHAMLCGSGFSEPLVIDNIEQQEWRSLRWISKKTLMSSHYQAQAFSTLGP